MGMPQKFLFNVSFDQPEPLLPPGARRTPAEPTFTRAELAAACETASSESRKVALAEAAQSSEERQAGSLAALERGIVSLLESRAELAREAETQAGALLRAVLLKAVPALCRKDPLTEIEALLTGAIGEALDEPRLVLRVSEALFEPVQKRLAGIALAGGYAGKLVLLADATLAEGDGRVEWADGGAERDLAAQCAQIDDLLDRHGDPAVTPNPLSA